MKIIVWILIFYTTSIFGVTYQNSKESLTNSQLKLIEELRFTYYKAVEEEDNLPEYEKYLSKNYETIEEANKALAIAYSAGIDIIKSKHAFWPLTKLNYLKKSLESLEKALKIEPNNLEVRFMRFSMLHYVPGFLGYSAERKEDANVILKELLKKNYNLVDKSIQKGIYQFILDSERLTEKDSELLISQLKGQFSNE